ncbi:hypothetical protein [Winogradskyella sp.]
MKLIHTFKKRIRRFRSEPQSNIQGVEDTKPKNRITKGFSKEEDATMFI